jgi:hypothetical protein
LGERIVEAARMAVAIHLYESLAATQQFGQQVVIGGAGPVVGGNLRGHATGFARGDDGITDDGLPVTHPAHGEQPSAGFYSGDVDAAGAAE